MGRTAALMEIKWTSERMPEKWGHCNDMPQT